MKPREFWIVENQIFTSEAGAKCYQAGRAKVAKIVNLEIIHLREVTDEPSLSLKEELDHALAAASIHANEHRKARHRIEDLEAQLREAVGEVETAVAYLESYDCDDHCDLEVGEHAPECCMHRSLEKWLSRTRKLLGDGK